MKQRAQQIIEEQASNIARLEAQIKQMQKTNFICAECRTSMCVCDLSNFRSYARKINGKRRKIEQRIDKMDLQVI